MTKSNQNIKRLFFGVEVHAPWPQKLPRGRILDAQYRHMTLVFLGNIDFTVLTKLLDDLPKPQSNIGEVGYFDSCLALAPRHPNVIAWHAHWLGIGNSLPDYQKSLAAYLTQCNFHIDGRIWLPHITLCRKPFDIQEWNKAFKPLPFYTGSLHLYESMEKNIYTPIWSLAMHAPFVEIEHTADVAFHIRGSTLLQLYYNAFTALAFKFSPLLEFYKQPEDLHSLDDLIILLNDIISRADMSIGSPLKAVSFHGALTTIENETLLWEMIVDVYRS